jgi:hypothetical protein
LGFPADDGLFRVLCVGYGCSSATRWCCFAVPFQYRDAMFAPRSYGQHTRTIVTLWLPPYFYGFGFVAASLCMFIVAWMRLADFINNLDYNIFCTQPVFIKKQEGWLTRLARKLDSSHA